MYVGIPLRTYSNYENDKNKINTFKYESIFNKLETYGYIDEEHGIVTIDYIITKCKDVFDKYKIEYCYLLGSYAKHSPKPESDIDLFINTNITGLKFFELVEELRESLKKNVDVINQKQVIDNPVLLDEILKYGRKIYG